MCDEIKNKCIQVQSRGGQLFWLTGYT